MNGVRQLKVTDVAGAIKRGYDAIIVSASYENRCFTVSRSIDRTAFKKAFVAGNVNHTEYIEPHWSELCSILGKDALRINLDSDRPIVSADSLIKAMINVHSDKAASVLVDISTFTRESLLMLIGILRNVLGKGTYVTCAYNSATSYGWLSRGIREIRSVLGFSGDTLPSRRNHLIVMAGYEVERAANLIALYEPNLLSIGYNKVEDSINPKIYDQQMIFIEQLCALYSSTTVKTFEASARDPFKTRDSILVHAGKFEAFNTILAPMNTKISSIGACLACCDDPRIQLCYAQPEVYNIAGYSEPSEDIFLFDITL